MRDQLAAIPLDFVLSRSYDWTICPRYVCSFDLMRVTEKIGFLASETLCHTTVISGVAELCRFLACLTTR